MPRGVPASGVRAQGCWVPPDPPASLVTANVALAPNATAASRDDDQVRMLERAIAARVNGPLIIGGPIRFPEDTSPPPPASDAEAD